MERPGPVDWGSCGTLWEGCRYRCARSSCPRRPALSVVHDSTTQAKKENPAWLTWLRYTAFIPLYPAGFISEALIIYKAIPDIKSAQILSIQLPNVRPRSIRIDVRSESVICRGLTTTLLPCAKILHPLPNLPLRQALNFGFDYSTLLWGLLLLYPFLSIYMFNYMLQQRKRKLKDVSLFGKSDTAGKKKDAGAKGPKGEDVAEVTTRGAREAAATRRRIRT